MKIRISPQRLGSRHRAGFTLVELLVSMAILAIMMLLVTQMIGTTSKAWKSTTSKIDAFAQARLGFQLMTSELAQATTNTYWDYFNSSGENVAQYNINPLGPGSNFAPAAYGRQSDLHFVSGPSSALNITFLGPPLQQVTHGVFFTWAGGHTNSSTLTSLNSLLNGTGFYIEFSADFGVSGTTPVAYFANGPPTSVLPSYTPKWGLRLVQFIQPTENLSVYNYGLNNNVTSNAWFGGQFTSFANHAANIRIVANNVIALVIWPKKIDTVTDTDPTVTGDTALAPFYSYDSRQKLTSGSPTTAIAGGSTTPTAANPYTAWTPGTNAQPLQMNQMPPILNIAMVSLDAPSAAILQGSLQTIPAQITTALNGLFVSAAPPAAAPTYSSPDPTYNSKISYMDNDLAALTSRLGRVKPKINFQVFETTIAIRSAKFSNP